MDRAEKAAFVASLKASLQNAAVVVIAAPNGLTVAESQDLRRKMRAEGARFKVAKNRLAKLALQGTKFEGLAPLLKGPTALCYSPDPVAAAKVTVEFAGKNEKLKVLGGSLPGRQLDVNAVKALATLPSLDTLRGKIVGLLQAPAGKIVGVLQAPGGQIARVLAARAEAQGKSEAA